MSAGIALTTRVAPSCPALFESVCLVPQSARVSMSPMTRRSRAARPGRSARTAGRMVQVENLAFENLSPLQCYRKLPAALALRPDLVVYAVSPFDLEQPIDPAQLADRNNPAASNTVPTTQFKDTWTGRVRQMLMNNSRAILIAQHFLFSNPETFLRVYLAHSDTGYLRSSRRMPHGAWVYSNFELITGDMASRTRRLGVPLFIMAVPSRFPSRIIRLLKLASGAHAAIRSHLAPQFAPFARKPALSMFTRVRGVQSGGARRALILRSRFACQFGRTHAIVPLFGAQGTGWQYSFPDNGREAGQLALWVRRHSNFWMGSPGYCCIQFKTFYRCGRQCCCSQISRSSLVFPATPVPGFRLSHSSRSDISRSI